MRHQYTSAWLCNVFLRFIGFFISKRGDEFMKNRQKKQHKKNASPQQEMRCPYCGKPVHLIPAKGILPPWSKITQLLACTDYPKCDSYVCVQPGTDKPLGSIADKKLRMLRQSAHSYFDQLYTSGYMTRDDAYVWLADKVFRPRSEAHIGNFSEYHCKLIIEESQKLLAYRRRHQDNVLGYVSQNNYDRRLHA